MALHRSIFELLHHSHEQSEKVFSDVCPDEVMEKVTTRILEPLHVAGKPAACNELVSVCDSVIEPLLGKAREPVPGLVVIAGWSLNHLLFECQRWFLFYFVVRSIW